MSYLRYEMEVYYASRRFYEKGFISSSHGGFDSSFKKGFPLFDDLCKFTVKKTESVTTVY